MFEKPIAQRKSRFSIVNYARESPTSQNSPEKPNSIQITHKAVYIFLLHVRHDKVSLFKRMTNCRGF